MAGDWSNGLFSCFNDCTTCILSWFVPCYVFGKNAEALGENCLMYALSQFVPYLDWYCRASVRGKIREQKGIEGSFIMDCILTGFCSLCTLVQEAQEIAPRSQSIARE